MEEDSDGEAKNTVTEKDEPSINHLPISNHNNKDKTKPTSGTKKKKYVTEKKKAPKLLNTTVIHDIPPVHHSDHSIEYINNEISSTTKNEMGVAEFLTSIEEHRLPQLRMNWVSHVSSAPQIQINPDSNSHSYQYYRNENELNRFVNSRTLYSISEAEENHHQPPQNPFRTFPRHNREVWFRTNPCYKQPQQNQYSINHRRTEIASLEPNSNTNVSLPPSPFDDDLPHQELMVNEPQRSLVQLPNPEINFDLHLIQNYNPNNNPRAFNYSIEQDAVLNRVRNNSINIPELHIYHNAVLNALANENVLMNELYLINLRLNELYNQNNNEAVNGIPNVEVDHIENIQVRPNNLLPVQENPGLPNFYEQNRYQRLPFAQLVLVANGGINPLNGGRNGLIQFIQNNPNLIFLNVRNVILIVHPSILEGNNNVLLQNNHWIPARALLMENNVALENEVRPDPNNQDLNQEAGPSNERD